MNQLLAERVSFLRFLSWSFIDGGVIQSSPTPATQMHMLDHFQQKKRQEMMCKMKSFTRDWSSVDANEWKQILL